MNKRRRSLSLAIDVTHQCVISLTYDALLREMMRAERREFPNETRIPISHFSEAWEDAQSGGIQNGRKGRKSGNKFVGELLAFLNSRRRVFYLYLSADLPTCNNLFPVEFVAF